MTEYLPAISALAPAASSAISAMGTSATLTGTNQAATAAVTGYNQAGAAALTTGTYNSQVEEARAQNALTAAASNASIVATKNAATMGQIGANFGASGVEGGTPLQVMQAAAIQGELTRQLTLYQGTTAALSDRQQGALDLFQANSTAQADAIKAAAASQAASNKDTSTLLTGAGNLLGPNSSVLQLLSKSGSSGSSAGASVGSKDPLTGKISGGGP